MDPRTVRTLQARLAVYEDRIRRKALNNSTSLISQPVDCVRLKSKKNREGDDDKLIVTKLDVVGVVFPPMSDVPIRRIEHDGENHWAITSLVDTYDDGKQVSYYKCEAPLDHDIDVGDMIVRVIRDDNTDHPTVLVMRVAELLGTLGGMELIKTKFNCTLWTDEIPEDLLASIMKMVDRRKRVGY
jgi:hypothetical protein